MQHSIFILHRNTLTGCVSPDMRIILHMCIQDRFRSDPIQRLRQEKEMSNCSWPFKPSMFNTLKFPGLNETSKQFHTCVCQTVDMKDMMTGAIHQKKKSIKSTVNQAFCAKAEVIKSEQGCQWASTRETEILQVVMWLKIPPSLVG